MQYNLYTIHIYILRTVYINIRNNYLHYTKLVSTLPNHSSVTYLNLVKKLGKGREKETRKPKKNKVLKFKFIIL